ALFWKQFEEELNDYQAMVGREIGSRVFMVKGMENLAENRIPAECALGLFAGKTAILLAGGPSLPESFAWVKAHREHVVVLAVSRIAEQLAQAGITVDCFFAIDPHDIIFHQSKGMLSYWQQSLLINVYHLNPRLLGQWRGRSLFMGPLFPWETPLNPSRQLSFPGITVSHQALGMAIEMGFSQIILAGFDLCYDRHGFTHAIGSEERKTGPFAAPLELWVETNGGWQAETKHEFLCAIPSLEQLAHYAQMRGSRVINPAPGAAKVGHVDHLPWQEVVVAAEKIDAWHYLQTILPPDTAENRLQHYEKVNDELLRMRNLVQQVTRLTSEAIICNDRFFGRKGKPPDFKYKLRMDAIERTLDEELRVASVLVKKWGVADFLKLSRPDKEREWSDQEIEDTGRRYYEIYRDSAGALTRLLDDIRQRLRARIEEEKAHPALKVLINQWQRDQHPGRVFRLLEAHAGGLSAFAEGVRPALQSLVESYQQALQETETDYKAYLFQRMATPQVVRARVMKLFRQKEQQRLLTFAEGLEQSLAESAVTGSMDRMVMEHKEQYVLLIRGLAAVLAGDFTAAEGCFGQISLPVLLTDALQQLLTVKLLRQDLLGALPIAKQLAQRATLHIPHYGDLLRLTGQREEAVAVYGGFVQLVKNDLVTLNKLGKLHGEMGNLEAARAVFTQVLQLDPGNKAAQLFWQQLFPADAVVGQP
ncbi:6-hydroxymethylpterin diphosphokinase MptE-like protein, partial [Candidatus Magnetaquicoccus inordinatus]|uniref:motility associated factor glycosyltransferase family protein n=1 Tax=Candidatus Magnetaquicoccus inordinatus TaxID=2496818 RepID=UPI00102B67E7